MDVLTAIQERRATREYVPEKIDREVIERLIAAAVQAPSARDLEPWAFVILDDPARLRAYSDEARRELLTNLGDGAPSELRTRLSDPGFDMFYGAPALVVICATSSETQAAEDCCLAAQNLMLAAHSEGLASCPIGFSRHWLSLPATKTKIGIPPEYVPVFPLVLGKAPRHPSPPGRRPPIILWR